MKCSCVVNWREGVGTIYSPAYLLPQCSSVLSALEVRVGWCEEREVVIKQATESEVWSRNEEVG